jgi:diguanylate cyclase (GGDEF)-like protein
MARQKVAAIYQDAGRTEDLIALYTRPVVETDRKLGPDHPTSIAARRNMVTAYRMSGRKDETLLILEQIVADYARVLGPDDPHTLASRSELGRGYILAERRGQAVDLFEELAVDLERLRGPDHPETGMALNRLFQAYNLAGRTEDAAKVLVLSAPVRGVDPLTGVAGRVGMEEAIQSALDELTFDSLRAHSEVTDDVVPGISLLIFDLDDLRIQNDRQGHAFGDEILVTVARRLTAIVRPVDSVARIGGDEFVVLVESVEDPADVAALADRILAAIRQPITVADQRVWMTCTIGSAAGGPGMTARQLLGHADKAMFAGKDQGGNCHVASADE